jgi:tartrate dehydratase beta subunit/fumarate hydratase class I family protein
MFPSKDLPTIVNDNNAVSNETKEKRKSLTNQYLSINGRIFVLRDISNKTILSNTNIIDYCHCDTNWVCIIYSR